MHQTTRSVLCLSQQQLHYQLSDRDVPSSPDVAAHFCALCCTLLHAYMCPYGWACCGCLYYLHLVGRGGGLPAVCSFLGYIWFYLSCSVLDTQKLRTMLACCCGACGLHCIACLMLWCLTVPCWVCSSMMQIGKGHKTVFTPFSWLRTAAAACNVHAGVSCLSLIGVGCVQPRIHHSGVVHWHAMSNASPLLPLTEQSMPLLSGAGTVPYAVVCLWGVFSLYVMPCV